MTQRIFDVENEQDMQDLWSILPDEAYSIKKSMGCQTWRRRGKDTGYYCEFIAINWHDKTEITRPIQEVTKEDIGKICCFWKEHQKKYGILTQINKLPQGQKIYFMNNDDGWHHCRRLTKEEIEELC